MTTTVTSGTSLVYTSQTFGSVGLIADTTSPSLMASLVGIKFTEDERPLLAGILGLDRDNTDSLVSSGSFIYAGQIFGGVGIIGITERPDLHAAYTIDPSKVRPGDSDLYTTIRAKKEASLDLGALIRAAASGSLDLLADIHGYDYKDLIGVIRAQRSGSQTLSGFIEPIPPKDLYAELQAFQFEDISGTITPVPPEELPATISGQLFLDLIGTIAGFDYSDIGATYCGTNAADLGTLISGLASGYANLYGQIHGYLGLGVSGDLGGYIIPQFSGSSDLDANISGVAFKDLYAWVRSAASGISDLEASISGDISDTLAGSITATGSISDLGAYIITAKSVNESIQAFIDGYGQLDLNATITPETLGILFASISPSGNTSSIISANISGSFSQDLTAIYELATEGVLDANIDPIPTSSLFAVIQPKVFFIDTTLPINTFPIKDLKAVINAYDCDFDSFYSELQVMISGTSAKDLSASLIAVAGQYAMTSDQITILNKAQVQSEDWMFLILKQPILAEDGIKIILTNSPLSDLSASIIGVQSNSDISANISSAFFASVKRDGVPIGQWVNTKTGERRLIKIFFEGNASNFYYSSLGLKTYSENAMDSLKVVVEIYTKEDESNSLLARKTEVKKCVINNLQDFTSIDSAIKYAIMCAAGEISDQLMATITAVGKVEELTANVDVIDNNKSRPLNAAITAVGNLPDIQATISGSGDISDLSGYIASLNPGLTVSLFTDTLGNKYIPKIVVHGDNQYSIVLTKVLSTDTISISQSPDLLTTISGIALSDLGTTISGS